MSRLAALIGLDVVLICLALIGFAQAAAKDETTTFEGVVFWVSVLALPVLALALLVLTGTALRRIARRP